MLCSRRYRSISKRPSLETAVPMTQPPASPPGGDQQEHREDAAGRIDRRRVPRGSRVERGPLPHERVHVRDRDEHLHGAAAQLLGDGKLVEIPAVVVVDGGPEKVTQVANGGVLVAGGRLDLRQLLERILREVGIEPFLAHRAARNVGEVGAVVAASRAHGPILTWRRFVEARSPRSFARLLNPCQAVSARGRRPHTSPRTGGTSPRRKARSFARVSSRCARGGLSTSSCKPLG